MVVSNLRAVKTKNTLDERCISMLNFNLENIRYNLQGFSPPSVFVGNLFYPKISVGPMISIIHNNTEILDTPELWMGKTIDDIINYKYCLVRGIHYVDSVSSINSRYVQNLQDLILSDRSMEVEALLEKKPMLVSRNDENIKTITNSNLFNFGFDVKIKTLKISSSISSNKKIEDVFNDTDLNSKDALNILYNKGIPISKIIKILSMGMIGLKTNRRLVPTKWSITATDKIISSILVKSLSDHRSVDIYEVYKFAHFGNLYSIIFIPTLNWSLEVHEGWISNNGNIRKEVDFENLDRLMNYPKIGGSYFAAKLSVIEFLYNQKRKATIIILREIRPEYKVPLGVWQIREGIRSALKKNPHKFESFEEALTFACNNLIIPKKEWMRNSKIYVDDKNPEKISNYF